MLQTDCCSFACEQCTVFTSRIAHPMHKTEGTDLHQATSLSYTLLDLPLLPNGALTLIPVPCAAASAQAQDSKFSLVLTSMMQVL